MTEEKRPHLAGAAAPPLRPKLGSAVGPTTRQAPTPLKVPTGAAGSPRPPVVAPTPTPAAPAAAAKPEPDANPAFTEVTAVMSPIAVEAALADLTSWRREADRRLAQLEAEVIQMRANGAPHAGPPTLDLSAATAPGVAMPAQTREPVPPWAAPQPAAHVAPVLAHAPAMPHAPAMLAVTPVVPAVAHAVTAPQFVAPPVAAAAQPIAAAAPVHDAASYAPSPPRVVSIAPRATVTPQYDLEMKPGEYFDMPTGLDGGRRKRRLVGVVMALILIGMAVLIITAVASQR